MSTSLIGEQREFKRRPAIRLGIVPVVLLAGVFPIAGAWGFQLPAFHPLGPTRPAVRSIKPTTAPVMKRPGGSAKAMDKMSPEMRKKIAEAMKHQPANRKSPPTKKASR